MTKSFAVSAFWLVLALALSFEDYSFGAFTRAASWREPHGHNGRLSPFDPANSLVNSLSAEAESVLKRGKTYKTSHDVVPGLKRVVVIQDVKAPKDVVLGRILDYDNYSKMAPQTLESETYQKQVSEATGETNFFSRLKTGMRGFALEFFVKATYHPKQSSVTWTLDYSKLSDIDDACGHWHVASHPNAPEKSRVFYSVDMIMGPSVPSFVGSFINKKAASDAAAWVKKFSEEQLVPV